jgi:hypothetical protein
MKKHNDMTKGLELDLKKKRDFASLEGFLKEALAVLEYYDVAHVPFIPNLGKDKDASVLGVCDMQRRLILLSNESCNMEKRKTIIHELIHARDFMVDGYSSERRTGRRTNYLFEQLYGY